MTIWDIFSIMSCLTGGFFFLAGTVAMLRFPDAMSRLHALTKADNLGLGFIVVGLCLRSLVVPVIIKLLLIWLTVLFASSTACYLVGHFILQEAQDTSKKS